MSDALHVQIELGIATLTLNRPAQRNALNSEILTALKTAFKEAQANPEVRVIALAGAGDQVFCVGADLKSPPDEGLYRELLLEIDRCRKPTVALARGAVLAGGIGLFCACDLALGCDDIEIGTPEIQVGMFPMMVTALLRRHLGLRKVIELEFLGERMSAQEAYRLGLVNRIFSRPEFEKRSREWLLSLAGKSASILALGKEAISKSEGMDLPEALLELERALMRVRATNDSREGIRAFVEKRPPQWSHT